MMNTRLDLSNQDTAIISALDTQFYAIRASIARTGQNAQHVVTLVNGIAALNAASHFSLLAEDKIDGWMGVTIVLFGVTYAIMMIFYVGTNFPKWHPIGIIRSDWDSICDRRDESAEEFANQVISDYIGVIDEAKIAAANKTDCLKCQYCLLIAGVAIILLEALYYVCRNAGVI